MRLPSRRGCATSPPSRAPRTISRRWAYSSCRMPRSGRRRRPDRGIRQDEYAHLRLIVRGARLGGEVAQPRRLGSRIRVERGLLHRAATGPKAGADHLVGIRLACDPVRPGPLGGAPPRKPRHGEIEAAAEKMDRAARPQKAPAEWPDHGVGLDEDAPEAIGVLGSVRLVGLILRKTKRVRQRE